MLKWEVPLNCTTPPHHHHTHTHTHTASPPVQCVENAPVSNLADLPQNLTSLAQHNNIQYTLRTSTNSNIRATYPVHT